MKCIIIFYNDNLAKYSEDEVFAGKNAKELSALWAQNIGCNSFRIAADSVSDLLTEMKALCNKESADYVIYAYEDLPFLNIKLTKDMMKSHVEYKSEYTFADGYPYGFAPELINAGTLGILAELSKTTQSELGNKTVERDSIYNLIKTDINSFEVDSEIAPTDWRLLRFAFHCGKKDNFLQCKALFESVSDKYIEMTAEELSIEASKNPQCYKTVPGFYNLQIADKVKSNYIYLPYKKAYEEKFSLSPLNAECMMSFEKYSELIADIAAFSENAVISLSAWGEPLLNPDCLKMIEKTLSYDGLSIFMETDGTLIDDDFCKCLGDIVAKAKVRTNGWQKIMIAVSFDAISANKYMELHAGTTESDFNKALESVGKLQNVIPGCVYPQFVRMNENEQELEGFYRYWNEKANPSGGNMIIQKYEDFAGLLPYKKPADLSPLERNPCWHLRRDMNILSNGDVTSCRCSVLSDVIGNVFNESLEKIWHKTDEDLLNHINKKYTKNCGKCDESYTYNF